MIEGVLGCVSQIGVRFLKFFGIRGLAARDFGLRRILQGIQGLGIEAKSCGHQSRVRPMNHYQAESLHS